MRAGGLRFHPLGPGAPPLALWRENQSSEDGKGEMGTFSSPRLPTPGVCQRHLLSNKIASSSSAISRSRSRRLTSGSSSSPCPERRARGGFNNISEKGKWIQESGSQRHGTGPGSRKPLGAQVPGTENREMETEKAGLWGQREVDARGLDIRPCVQGTTHLNPQHPYGLCLPERDGLRGQHSDRNPVWRNRGVTSLSASFQIPTAMQSGKSMDSEVKVTWILIRPRLISGILTLATLLNHCEPHFPHQ